MENRLKLLGLVTLLVALFTLPGCSNDDEASPPTAAKRTNAGGGQPSTSPVPVDQTTDRSDQQKTTSSQAAPGTTPAGGAGTSNGDGCWVHLYDDDNFDERDDNLRLTTPGRYGDLRSLPGSNMDWTGEADSIRVGPAATVTVWEHTGFRGSSEVLSPGSEHPDMHHEPSSLEMTCP